MRTSLFLITIIGSISTFNLSSFAAATGGASTGGGGAAAGSTAGGRSGAFAPAGSRTVNPATGQTRNSSRTIQNGTALGGITPQNQAQFGATNGLGVGVNSNGLIFGTNGLSANPSSNGFLVQTNQFLIQSNGLIGQTNTIGVLTNQTAVRSNSIFNPTAAVVPGFPQTNTATGALPGGATTLPSAAQVGQDRAANQNDRTTLVQIHRNIRGIFPSPATLAGVHFQVRQGVVTAVGSVQNLEQKQQVLQMVLSTPNVVQVVDNLQVNVPPGSPVSRTGFGAQAPPAVGRQVLTPTGGNNQFGINPGLLPTVPTNAIPPTGSQ